jgi:hypothetical protein
MVRTGNVELGKQESPYKHAHIAYMDPAICKSQGGKEPSHSNNSVPSYRGATVEITYTRNMA